MGMMLAAGSMSRIIGKKNFLGLAVKAFTKLPSRIRSRYNCWWLHRVRNNLDFFRYDSCHADSNGLAVFPARQNSRKQLRPRKSTND